MSRAVLDTIIAEMAAAYRGADPFHSIRGNLDSVQPDEWDVRPAEWRTDVFGTAPELSIADIVDHVGASKRMYANHAFGDAALAWEATGLVPAEMEAKLAWLDESHRVFADGVQSLADDAQLAEPRPIHSGQRIPTSQIIFLMINHDLYHSGEINRQRALIRGANGWQR